MERKDLGDDPLDPHGDGTIGPGDPMWIEFEKMISGESDGMLANRIGNSGTWNVEHLTAPAAPEVAYTKPKRRWWKFW